MFETKIQSLKKSVSEIISYLVNSFVEGIRGTTFLVLFLAMGIFFAFYISLIQVPDSIMELLDESFSVILITITAMYVHLTNQIVKQTNKNSEIAFIEKRLEKLYYPLRDILYYPVVTIFEDDQFKYIDLNKMYNIVPFQYLASKNMAELLDDFIKTANNKRLRGNLVDATNYEKYTKYEIVTEEIKTTVDEDIETYKTELKKLIKHRD